jgi:glycosyltransferase involved in cell wall biosynthesis
MGRVLVVLPTHNEAGSVGGVLENLVETARGAGLDLAVLVVDDASTDGTREIVGDLAARLGVVFLLARPGKMGLGSAYIDGFRWGLRNMPEAEVFVEMDADGSHDPRQLPRLVEPVVEGRSDVAVGSRYVVGGGWRGGALSRRLISRGANLLARLATGLRVRDATSGYRAISRRILEAALSGRTTFESGYVFQVDTLLHFKRLGARIVEVPIDFYERASGRSKLSIREILRFALWCLRQPLRGTGQPT